MKKTLYNVAFYGSLLYVALAVIGFALSFQLPYAGDAGVQREHECYWTRDKFMTIKCGEQVIAGGLRVLFYGLGWILVFILGFWIELALGVARNLSEVNVRDTMMIALYLTGVTLVFYAPVFFLVFAFVRWVRRKRRGGHGASGQRGGSET